MKKTIDIRLHGRGGQGTVTAAELIAVAAFYEGKETQAFPSFGVERRGAPVSAYVRISEDQIRLREQIYEPDYVILQDPTLLSGENGVLSGVNKKTIIIINTEQKEWPELKNNKYFIVPASRIAMEKIGKPFFNTAIVAAFAAVSGLITLKSLGKAILERFEKDVAEKNIAAAEEAFKITSN